MKNKLENKALFNQNDGSGGGAPPEGEAPAFDPAKFQEEMKDFTVRAVNGAVSTHLTRALDKRLEENNAGILSKLQELMPQQAAASPAPTVEPSSDLDAAIKNATAPLMKQLEEQRALNERNAAAAKAEQDKRMQQEEQSALSQALSANGVPGPLAQAAVHVLRGSLERDSSGSLVYVSKENGPTGQYEERISIEEGVSRYLRTDEGKHFLPARAVGGAGNTGGSAPAAAGGKESDGDFVGRMLSNLLG